MAGQITSVAIGNPVVGGFVVGGENAAKSFTLLDFFPTLVSRNQIGVSLDFYLQSSDPTSVSSFAALVQAALGMSKGSMSLGVATKPATKTITVTISSSGQELTVTRTAGSSFAATDVAMPLDIASVGSFMITSYTSSSEVKCLLAPGLTVPANAAGLTATIGTEFLRIDEAGKIGGFRSEVTVGEAPGDDSDRTRKPYRIEASWERPGSDGRGSSFAQRREAKYRVSTSPSGIKTVEFSGTYTAGAGGLATGNYAAAVNTWINGVLSALSAKPFMIVGSDAYAVDDENAVLTFEATRKEINIAEAATATDHPAIENAQIQMSFQRINEHGLEGHLPPGIVSLEYSAHILESQASTPAAIKALWDGTILPYLIAVIRACYGGAVVLQVEAGPTINPTDSTISASLGAFITDSGSDIVDYTKTISYEFDEQKTFRRKHDGKGHTYHIWTPGATLEATVIVQVTRLGKIVGGGGGSSAGFGIGAGLSVGFGGAGTINGLGTSGAIAITFGDGGSGGGSDQPEKTLTEFPKPTASPGAALKFDSFPDGYWEPLGRSVRVTPKFVGRNSAGSRENMSGELYAQRFRWVALESASLSPTPELGSRQETGGAIPQGVASVPRE